MADTNTVGGLKWVKDEIVTSLQRVRGWLEELVERGSEQSHLNDVVTALSEVRGVLSALQLTGLARVTEEMQILCEDLQAESLPNRGEAAEALMLALIQFPDYLDKLEAGQLDVPLALLPSINDLRGSRGAAPLSEAELLVPASVLAESEMPAPDVQRSLAQIAAKVRPHFHLYLLQWLREDTSRQGLVSLGRLFHRLQRYIGTGVFHELFLVAEAVVEALLEGSIAADDRTKALVAHLDRVIKPFITGPEAWPEADAQAQLFDLLSLIARCQSSSYRVNELRTVYGLEQVVEGEEATPVAFAAQPATEALGMLVAEARKELTPIKDALDLFARGDREDRDLLLEMEPPLRNLANTLAVTGADDLVDRLRRCANELGAMGKASVPSDDMHLMMVAEELLTVEAVLGDLSLNQDSVSGSADARILRSRALDEARVDMARAEQAIADLVETPSDHRTLKGVPELFHRVAGALRMLAENDAAEVLDLVAEHLGQRVLAEGRAPGQVELELLAQAISGIDLYIAGLSESEPYRSNLVAEAGRAVDELTNVQVPLTDGMLDEVPPEPEEPDADVSAPRMPIIPVSRIDPEFLDIFIEEAKEEEQTIRHQFARWRDDEDDEIALTTLRRSFHTLKGSGRLVGSHRIGELARAAEMLLNRVSDRTLDASTAVMGFMEDTVGMLPDLIAAEAEAQPLDVTELIARAESLARAAPGETVAPGFREPGLRAAKVIPWPATAPPRVPSEAVARTPSADDAEADPGKETAAEVAALAVADDELLDIFRSEAREHLAVLQTYFAGVDGDGDAAIPDEPVVRALHTLTGSARMTGVVSTAKVTASLERLFQDHQERGAAPNAVLLAALGRAIDAVEMRLTHLPGYGDEMAALQELSADLEVAGEVAPEEEILAPEVSEERSPGKDIPVADVPGEIVLDEESPAAEVPVEFMPEEEIYAPEQLDDVPPALGLTDGEAPALAAHSLAPLPPDQELITLFLEDAREILDRLDQNLRDLQLAPTASGPLEEMQRSLHTLKGSARLSGLAPIGDLSHAYESLLTAITKGEARVDDDNLELSQRALDALSDQIDAVEQGADLSRGDDLIQALSLALQEGLAGEPEAPPDVAVMAPTPATAGEIGEGSAPAFISLVEAGASGTGNVAEVATPQIRVRSDLLNRLVNQAGEISIYRSRLSQQGGLMSFRLGELDRTVDRLRNQLRHLEIETEAQIFHRYERDADTLAPGQKGFDPLELDRFSTLQQLSRSLAETVNDLGSLRTLLQDLQGESDTLLQQQARIAEDLQDGLLRTRMVPFVQAVPRLHRVVRQTAQQMGKEARLEVFGPEVELDRSIQERIVAPLEHLLRNAVAHGIEPSEQRKRAGKPAAGVVSLILNREGNDVVITVADDGAGLDLEVIRQRAVDRGLILESADAGEEELIGLILEAGFSTVHEVSQIAGRGVGLDVVNAEVKQLSGAMGLETQPGRGTSFTIRLPLTLAIIEALLVQVGSQVLAIPQATIEAASRIGQADLKACYQGQGRDFAYSGHEYRVMYLGSMLQLAGGPDLGERRWLPVLLARSGDQRIAFHVDDLLGTQRVVVKPLGPELSSIRWLSGGTILPDGRVAMILDLLALIRSAAVKEYRPPMQTQPEEQTPRPCVLVVDDSLTVRRVTSRLLRRQNLDVITATDGIDALTRLEERVPDVILLDIEMPRMDGYELTRHIRRSERFKDIPLIMITSRTGEKHRRHAIELGVDRYLGKPYQEADLLDEISSVLVEASL